MLNVGLLLFYVITVKNLRLFSIYLNRKSIFFKCTLFWLVESLNWIENGCYLYYFKISQTILNKNIVQKKKFSAVTNPKI